MAYERISDVKVKGEGLDVFVEMTMKMYERQLAARNADDELRFNQAVLEQDLSLEDQLSYRQEQFKRVSDDPNERKRVRLEIANLKDRIQQKEFSDDYLSQLIGLESGIASVDSVIGWLRSQASATTDPTIKTQIQKELVTHEQRRFTSIKNLIENQTEYAIKDESESVIKTQVSRVTGERNKALLSGNNELVSIYDLQLQALERSKSENSIQRDIVNFAVSTASGYMTATQLLDAYNDRIARSSGIGKVKVGDTIYASPQEFWSLKRNEYLTDSSSKGFFPRFSDEERNTLLKVKNSRNALVASDIQNITAEYTTLLGRPELAGFEARISSERQNTIQTGVDLLAKNAINRYSATLDVNQAIGELNALKAVGGNIDDSYFRILNSAAQVKETQVGGILNKAQEIMKDNPATTPEQALNQALQTGAGVVLSPEQLVSKSEKEIAQESAKGSVAGSFRPDPRTTATPPNQPSSPPPVVPQRFIRFEGKPEVYDVTQGKLRHVDMPEFQRLGNPWSDVKIVSASNIPLLRQQDKEEVFADIGGQKVHVPDPETFSRIGFDWTKVKVQQQPIAGRI